MANAYLSIPYHIPNKSADRKQRSCFSSRDQCTAYEGLNTDDVGIVDIRLNLNTKYSLPSVTRNWIEYKTFEYIESINTKNVN